MDRTTIIGALLAAFAAAVAAIFALRRPSNQPSVPEPPAVLPPPPEPTPEDKARQDAAVTKVEAERQEGIKESEKKAAERVEAVGDDPQKLNDLLKQIGDDAREASVAPSIPPPVDDPWKTRR